MTTLISSLSPALKSVRFDTKIVYIATRDVCINAYNSRCFTHGLVTDLIFENFPYAVFTGPSRYQRLAFAEKAVGPKCASGIDPK